MCAIGFAKSSCLLFLAKPMSKSTAQLSNGEMDLTVALPGAPDGYRGARFSWAGIISEATWGEHHLFGPWRPGMFPPEAHDNVSGTAGEFGMGTVGMPPPLGFDAAAPGGLFVKIGVGIVRRPDDAPYAFSRHYEVVDAPAWHVQTGEQQVAMRQSLEHDGYGYDYTHTIELVPNQPVFITQHVLTNTGRRPFHQTHYSHNFLVINRAPIGPDYEVVFPFAPEHGFEPGGVASIDGRKLTFREPLKAAVFDMLDGFDGTTADNQVTVRHRGSGVELRITGDRPIVRYHIFAAPGAICPEPFIDIRLEPGESMTWQHRYELYASRG